MILPLKMPILYSFKLTAPTKQPEPNLVELILRDSLISTVFKSILNCLQLIFAKLFALHLFAGCETKMTHIFLFLLT